MNLLGSFTSPFVRQVRVVILEKGLESRIFLDETNPFSNPAELLAANPLGKVPALVGTDVGTLHDSRVICAYLDTLSSSPSLLPEAGPAYWKVLRRQSTAIGLMDAAAAHVMEARREDGMISPLWQQRRAESLLRGAQSLEEELLADGPALDLGWISAAVALAYMDFRHPTVGWRADMPELAAWLDDFSQRPSMQRTQPPAP